MYEETFNERYHGQHMVPTKMKIYKKGDKLNYTPRALLPEDKPMKNCTVDMFQPAGEIFNQPMVSVKEINHWIPVCDCAPCT